MFGNTDIRALFLHICRTKRNDCREALPNGYSPHISYILLRFPNTIPFLLPLNLIAVLSMLKRNRFQLDSVCVCVWVWVCMFEVVFFLKVKCKKKK